MPKKKKTPAEQLRELSEKLQERHERWNRIMMEGCSDPFWPDGTNLYLVRNHCISYCRQIAVLCETYGLDYPEIYHRPLPPELPMNFMAKPRQTPIDVPSFVTSSKPFKPIQLSLF